MCNQLTIRMIVLDVISKNSKSIKLISVVSGPQHTVLSQLYIYVQLVPQQTTVVLYALLAIALLVIFVLYCKINYLFVLNNKFLKIQVCNFPQCCTLHITSTTEMLLQSYIQSILSTPEKINGFVVNLEIVCLPYLSFHAI